MKLHGTSGQSGQARGQVADKILVPEEVAPPVKSRKNPVSPSTNGLSTPSTGALSTPSTETEVRRWTNERRPNRPFVATWRDLDGVRHEKTFADEAARDGFADALDKKIAKVGKAVLAFDPRAWEDFQAFRRRTEFASLDDIADSWNLHRVKATITVADAVKQFLADKEREGVSEDSLRHYRMNFARFVARFGTMQLSFLSAGELKGFLDGLPFAPATKSSHHRCLRSLFGYAKLYDWLDKNPMLLVKPIKLMAEPISVLSLEEGRRLFKENRDESCIGRLALEAFAGLRFASAQLIRPQDIDWTEKGIEFEAARIKTGRRHYIDGMPENLWQWMKHAPEECWSMTERQYLDKKSKAFIRAKVDNPGNVLRHSFCSYHYAAYKNPPLTAAILCHTNLKMLQEHYKGKATQKDGLSWFDIVP